MTFAVDEHPRRDTTLEKLASLKPLHPEIEGFSITAGNASGVNDGAAAMVVAEPTAAGPARAAGHRAGVGLRRRRPRPRPGWPRPIAIPKALGRAGLAIDDVDLWEINEAFASMCVGHRHGSSASTRTW